MLSCCLIHNSTRKYFTLVIDSLVLVYKTVLYYINTSKRATSKSLNIFPCIRYNRYHVRTRYPSDDPVFAQLKCRCDCLSKQYMYITV